MGKVFDALMCFNFLQTVNYNPFVGLCLGSVRSKTILYENTAFRSVYEELTECFGAKPDSVVLCTQAGGTQHAIKKPVAVSGVKYWFSIQLYTANSFFYRTLIMQDRTHIVIQKWRNWSK